MLGKTCGAADRVVGSPNIERTTAKEDKELEPVSNKFKMWQ
jgi:hypothetical protein